MDESCFQKADGIVVNVVYDNQLGVQSTFWKVPERSRDVHLWAEK